ncbi:MAG: metallophosphoesterase family protein [Candidatus Gastranaerophilaceae bacterium]|jgi:putative phosphoesterase
MKIAIMSDIHGNIEALNAVLEDIERENCEKMLILGDLAMAGPEPNETINLIKNLMDQKDIEIIQGNTDEMIVKHTDSPQDQYTPPNTIMLEALKYTQQVISDENKEFLTQLPPYKYLTIGQTNILIVHGSPRRNNEDILPGQPIESIVPMLSNINADLIFCGHTHLPAGYQIGDMTIVNDGSVGRPFTEEPKACYVVLDIPDLSKNEFGIEHKFIDYDFKQASEKLRKLPFEGADKLADMLIKATCRYPQ